MRILSPPPEFAIPLGGEHLRELGLFCVVWSQIDMLISLLLADITRAAMVHVTDMTGNATTTPRITMLRKIAKSMLPALTEPAKTDASAKDRQTALIRLVEICSEMYDLAEKRNHLMHGLWAVHWAPNGETQAGSHFDRNRDKPVFARDLAKFTDQAARFSSDLGWVWRTLNPKISSEPPPRTFFFGPGDPATKKPPKPLEVLP